MRTRWTAAFVTVTVCVLALFATTAPLISQASVTPIMVTFDEIANTTLVGGITVNGVTFTSSEPVDTFYNATNGPNEDAPPSGNFSAMDNNVLEGHATATLTLLFAQPVRSFSFAVALDSWVPIDPAVSVTLYDASSTQLNVLPLTTGVAPMPVYDGGIFSYDGSLGDVLRAVLTFDSTSGPRPAGARFALDNLAYTPAPLPLAWSSMDIGSVKVGPVCVKLPDTFRFVYQSLTGDGEIIARVASLVNTDGWAKAGVMIRQDLTPGSRYAALVVSAVNGLAFQRRLVPSGLTTYISAPGSAPTWVRLTRTGDTFRAYGSADGATWTLIGTDTIALGSSVFVGLAVTSHNNGVLTTATFDNVTASTQPMVTLTLATNMAGLSLTYDGASVVAPFMTGVTAVGSSHALGAPSPQTVGGRTYQFIGWSDAGAQTHAITTPSANTIYTATYQDVTAAPSVMLTLATNIAGLSLTFDGLSVAVPFTASAEVGSTRTLGAPSPQIVGGRSYQFVGWSDGGAATHAITTPGANSTYTATYGETTPLWLTQDIGSVTPAGSARLAEGVFTVSGAGADIWNAADAFRFVFKPLTGDGEIIARVTSLVNTDGWAKAGVMIREDLTAESRNAALVVSAVFGLAFQRRQWPAQNNTYTAAPGAAPTWVRLTRTGNALSAYRSSDGVTWTFVGTDTLFLPPSVYIGLAVTSHNNGVLTTATFDNVTVSQ